MYSNYQLPIEEIQIEDCWSLASQDLVWELNKKSKGAILSFSFGNAARNLMQQRGPLRVQNWHAARKLRFFPDHCLFEDVAEGLTRGFLGSGDCPPPELWHRVEEDTLLSIIPDHLIHLAQIGIDVNVNDTLLWDD